MRDQNLNERPGEAPKPGEAPPQSKLPNPGETKQIQAYLNQGQEFNERPELQ